MKEDRKAVCKIISEMLDNPDECGIYPTTRAYDALVILVDVARVEAIGWAHADACVTLDNGLDPRKQKCSDMLRRALKDLCGEKS